MIRFFILWYLGSLLIFTLYQINPKMMIFVAMNMYYPALLGIFAFFYFRKSVNDWNDRFFVAFGWIFFALICSAILVKPVYGYDWTNIINLEVIKSNWTGVFVIILAAFFARKKIPS
ncbi:MAG: hypothetical protein AAB664_02460 [Patescibacteria group bacterium]